jgi:hypothetical protein
MPIWNALIPFAKELLHQTSHKAVLETTEKLKKYNIQVNPREINLFYIEDKIRERIILEEGKINNTKIEFSEENLGIIRIIPKCLALMWLCVPYIRKWFYPIYLTSVEAEPIG